MTYIADVHDYSGEPNPVAEEFISQGRQKQIMAVLEELVNDEFERLQEYASGYISDTAADRAQRFLERVLQGDEDAAMALLGSKDNSDRYRGGEGYDAGKPWANLIHGSLFETGGIRLRRQIVEANADLLQNERIKDLESVVDGLTQQVRQLTAELEYARDRLTE